MLTRAKIIGGMFGLEPRITSPTIRSLLRPGDLLFLNARSAIHTLLIELQPPSVWLPTFLCDALIQATRVARHRRFYSVGENLDVQGDDWIDDVAAGDLVILIRYFGLPLDHEVIAALTWRGAMVVEDASQVLASDDDSQATFTLFSPRKFVGVPDGGILRPRDPSWRLQTPLVPPPTDWLRTATAASRLRRRFDEDEPSPALREKWFRLFRDAESRMPCGPYAMSELSRGILESSLQPFEIQRRRAENFRCLAERLRPWGLLPVHPPCAAPLGYPIVTDHRDRLRRALLEEEIFAPVHWPTPAEVPARFLDCRRLASRILTLPCDQRLDARDLARMVEVVRRCLH